MATTAPGARFSRSRRPERTLLYRARADQFERFLGVYEERFEPTHGYLRRSVERAVYRYLACGIFAHGAARAHCAECGHDVLIAFSCMLRCLCPSCHQKRELFWVEWASELLAEVSHRQVVLRLLVARGKISQEVVENSLTWRHSGLSVDAGVRVEERSEAVRLGRYGIRCPLVLERLEWGETSGEVIYRARPGRHDARGESVARCDVLAFLARLLEHLPDPSQQLLRYWGWYSKAAGGRRMRQQQSEPSSAPLTVTDPQNPQDAEGRQRRLTWSQRILEVCEIDPLLCPYCAPAVARRTAPSQVAPEDCQEPWTLAWALGASHDRL